MDNIRGYSHLIAGQFFRFVFLTSLFGKSADAEQSPDIDAVDDGRCATLANQWQWLSGLRGQSNGNRHVEQSLRHQ